MRPTPKKIILGLCVFSLSLIAIACSSKIKDVKQTITVNTALAASVPTKEDKAIPKYGWGDVVDKTRLNHYSLLRTTEDTFGIYKYLNHAGDTGKEIKPMTSLFAK